MTDTSMTMHPVLSARNVSLGFDGTTVLAGVDLTLHPQEFVAVVGASGVGKSTLLRALAGLLAPQSGRVDIPAAITPDTRAWSMVFQAPRLFPWRRVRGNVELGLEGLSLSKAERRRRALEPLALVGLDEFAERWPHTLSGGQQQRLCIARALAVEPSVILMDEPCSALDPIATLAIEELMRELSEDYSIIIVTHNMQQAARVSDETAFLMVDEDRAGYLVEVGNTEQIFTNPQNERTEAYITGRFS